MKIASYLPLCFVIALLSGYVATAAVTQKPAANAKIRQVPGILVLDNCDPEYKGKKEYSDNLTLVNRVDGKRFRLSGFNNCEAISSAHMIATDRARRSIWVIENVGGRIRRFGPSGKVTLTIPGVKGSAIAVDPETGNLWVLENPKGMIGQGQTLVYNPAGKKVAAYAVTGWDIAYDRHSKSFWITDRKVTKINSANGEIIFSKKICGWCASSIEIDPRSGNAWIGIPADRVAGARNRLLKLDPNGKELHNIPLKKGRPKRISADFKDGSVWVVNGGSSIERFSKEGKSTAIFPVKALAVQVDPQGFVWAVTKTEIQMLTPTGKVVKRLPHAGETSQAWIGLMK